MNASTYLNAMAAGYLEAAAFCTQPDKECRSGEFVSDRSFSIDAKFYALAVCSAFIVKMHRDLSKLEPADIGRDVFFDQHGHGTGFLDRELGERGERLSNAAAGIREKHWYVDDNNRYSAE